MKKILIVCVVIASSISLSNSTQAQTKIGVFDDQSILSLMPGIQKVDTLLQKYGKDSLQTSYDEILTDYQYKDSVFKRDSATMPASVKKVQLLDLNKIRYQLANWQQTSNEKMQAKQQELLKPYLEKIYAALQIVIKEQKYTYIFKPENLVFAEKSDEVPLRVIQKLGIPVPKEIADQIKALGSSASSAPAKAPIKH
jgi:Skp family chaperone for outer membrane proteins